jgi:hypothetical protein
LTVPSVFGGGEIALGFDAPLKKGPRSNVSQKNFVSVGLTKNVLNHLFKPIFRLFNYINFSIKCYEKDTFRKAEKH